MKGVIRRSGALLRHIGHNDRAMESRVKNLSRASVSDSERRARLACSLREISRRARRDRA
jgi:hypothetical protein